ncbi:hypothetical protein QSE00_00390 [Arenibacter sp. M-2]|uniref:hypothetical protein n=1 Tax=Arenibacter sp. M-2 TaxID=3053612 RepID=UPI002570934A|nr:hypothetical protein [Arenibacter sp. M-2]MDL5510252.1 hypothetical protein [Arenibacter sp. M-2]
MSSLQIKHVFQKGFLTTIIGYMLCLLASGCTYDLEYHVANIDPVMERPSEWINYMVSEYDNGIYKDTLQTTRIIPERSALVLIDVWRDEFLDPFVIDHINPIIEEFSAQGMKIIYAPSQMPENKNLLVIDEGVHFYDFETMDSYLRDNNIQNLIYSGFDTFYCVLDKPNGIYNLKMRNDSFRTFVLERGVLSYTKEMMEASMELLKKNGVGIIPYDGDDKTYPQQTLTDIHAKTKSSARPKWNSFIVIFQNNDTDEALENFKLELDTLQVKYGIVETGTLTFQGEEVAPENFSKFLRDKKI